MRRRRYWPRYVLVTESGFGRSSVELAPVQYAAESMRRAGWKVTVITARNAYDRMSKAKAFWAKCRETQ